MTNTMILSLRTIDALACREDFCHICGRCTDHGGEHSDDQLLLWAMRPGMLQDLLPEKH